jgi:glycosidase
MEIQVNDPVSRKRAFKFKPVAAGCILLISALARLVQAQEAAASADEAAAPIRTVSHPAVLSLHFDSRDLRDKAPFGAVPAGTRVQFSLDAMPGIDSATLVIERRELKGNEEVLEYTEAARVPLQRAKDGARERWLGNWRFDGTGVYGYWFEVRAGGRTWVYQNNNDSVYWSRERGSDGLGLVAPKPDQARHIRRFRQTVYAPDFKVPGWARDAVYYYIFPERFRNGDRANDPRPGRDRYQDKPVEFHADWLEKPYRPGSDDGSDAWANNDFFGGDIAGIIDKLDYIAGLGANTLYITPMFRASSNHKYDTADYKHIDPSFGSDADFSRLTAEAARRGIRVIPDASLNHTGSDSIYFDRFAKYATRGAFRGEAVDPASPYATWYRFDASQASPDKRYKGWAGAADLPELNKADPGFRHYAYGAPDSVMNTWLDRGAAGWRMDVAPWVPDDFWREWRAAVKHHCPDALTVAETWFNASKFLLGDTFDSTMNYIFRNTVLDYAAGGKAASLYHNIELMREEYPPQAFYALMNLLSTHDVARSLYYLGYHGEGDPADAVALAKQRFRLAVLFQMIFPGAPALYYGDEVGVTGGDDPYNRATWPWPDRGGKPDTTLMSDVTKLIKMRNDYPVLRHGSISAPVFIDDHVIVLARQDGTTWAITATNNAGEPKMMTVQLPKGLAAGAFVDALSGARVDAVDGKLTLTVPARFGIVLVTR